MRVEPSPTLRFAISFCLAAASLLPLGFAHAEPADDSLRLYAVDIWQDPPNHGDQDAASISEKGSSSPQPTSSA